MKNLFFLLLCSFFLHSANAQQYFLKKVKGKYMYGLNDASGKQIVPPKYDQITDFKEGFARIDLNGKWGFIDQKGTEIVSPRYDHVKDFEDGWASVEAKDKWGLINTLGTELVTPKYKYPIKFNSTDFAEVAIADPNDMVWGNSIYGLLDKSFKEVLAPKYHSIVFIDFGFIMVTRGAVGVKAGLLDANYKEIIPVEYDNIVLFSKYLIGANKKGSWVLLNSMGSRISNFEYESVFRLQNNRGKVKRSGKFGFIDETGKEIISCIYDEADSFLEEGVRVRVKLGGREYFIDKNGKEIK